MEKLLPEVCDIQYGFPFDSSKFSVSEGMPIIRIRDVLRGYSETFITQEFDENYIVKDGDILIGMDGEFNIAKWGKQPALLNQRVCRLFPKDNIDADYLFYFLQGTLKKIEDRTAFATVKHLSAKELNKIAIPFPPVEEQKRIGKALNKTNELISCLKEQLAKLDELVKARFVEMFGDQGYPENTLLNLCNIIDYRGKTPEKVECGLPFITAKNVRMHQMNLEPREYISKETYDKVMVRGFPKEGDVVFTTEAPLGNVCRIPHFDTEFYIGQRIVTMQTEKLEPIYLEYALSSDDFKTKYMEKSSGSTVTGIRVRLLEQLTILVPPMELQKQFANFVERTEKTKAKVQKSLDELEILKKSLMQKYFG